MPRIWSAPSEARAAGAAGTGAAAFAGTVPERRERLREIRTSAESSPENKRLKKARNANTIRFNSMAPRFKDSKAGQARRPVLHQNRLPQTLQLAAGDLGPLSGMIQLQVGLPMVDGLHGLALAFAQQRQVEVRVGVLRVQIQRAPVEIDSFRKASLLVVQVAQVELRQRIFGIRLDGRQVVFLGLLELVQTVVDRAQIGRASCRER